MSAGLALESGWLAAWSTIHERTRAEHDRFRWALGDVQAAQRAQLDQILYRNRHSAIGRRYEFAAIDSPQAFQQRVPIHKYDDLAPLLSASCDGVANQAVGAPVVLAECTSGTTAAPRWLPYTEGSLKAFQRALYPWLHDLLEHVPALGAGHAYFALSPATRPGARSAGDIPIGANNDAIYFGDALMTPFAEICAVPPSITRETQADNWRYLTLRHLLDADDLSLFSVWSPSFLTTLLDSLVTHASALAYDIKYGGTSLPHPGECERHFPPRPERAAVFRSAMRSSPPDLTALWPSLALISCWTDAGAARFVPFLEDVLPDVPIQGKGLLATECAVSVPLYDAKHPLLAINSGFFEFIDDGGECRFAHQLEDGARYRVLLTTYGGLYRYELGDIVQVRGFFEDTPQLQFVGRGDRSSDLCGEKLTEVQVQAALEGTQGFALLVPDTSAQPGYRLILSRDEHEAWQADAIAKRVDTRLRENPHYDHARRIGQLSAVQPARHLRPLDAYLNWMAARGQRLGDIKPALLYCDADWPLMFQATDAGVPP